MDSSPVATTRDKLITAALDVIAAEGLEAASVKTIAAAAGVTPGLLHYHFPSKEKLLEAGLRQAAERYLEASRRRRLCTPPDQQINALLLAARDAATADVTFFRVRLAFAARALSDPALAATFRALNADAVQETAEVLAAARGAAAPSPRDLAIAATLKAIFDGIMLAWLNDPDFPLDTAQTLLQTALAEMQQA